MAGLDDTKNCPVCLDEFDAERLKPRILPCSHSTCEVCLRKLLKFKNPINCPMCRKRHSVKSGLKAFPENRYILEILKIQPSKFDKCKKHGRDLSLYCKDVECRTEICQLCLLNCHKDHEVLDIVQEGDSLAEHVKKIAEQSKTSLYNIEKNMSEKCEEAIASLKKKKKEVDNAFESCIQDVRSCANSEKADISRRIDTLDQYITEIDEKREQFNGTTQAVRSFDSTLQKVKDVCAQKRSYSYYTCNSASSHSIQAKEICSMTSQKRRLVTHPWRKIPTTFSTQSILCMLVLRDDTILVCKREKSGCRLINYTVEGNIVKSADLETHTVRGLAEIRLHPADHCIAVSIGDDIVEFRYYRDLKIYIHVDQEFAQYQTNQINCLASLWDSSLLLFEEFVGKSVYAYQWKSLGFHLFGILPAASRNGVADMCVVSESDVTYVVIATGSGQLHAYDLSTESPHSKKWEADQELGEEMKYPLYARGVTSDSSGYLYVIDKGNNCIQKFSNDGNYLGVALHENDPRLWVNGQEDQADLQWVRCFRSVSTAAIGYRLGDNSYICVAQLDMFQKSPITAQEVQS